MWFTLKNFMYYFTHAWCIPNNFPMRDINKRNYLSVGKKFMTRGRLPYPKTRHTKVFLRTYIRSFSFIFFCFYRLPIKKDYRQRNLNLSLDSKENDPYQLNQPLLAQTQLFVRTHVIRCSIDSHTFFFFFPVQKKQKHTIICQFKKLNLISFMYDLLKKVMRLDSIKSDKIYIKYIK